MNADLLKTILEKHLLFLQAKGGEKANLRGANLRGANLSEADLRRADLREADLRGADLRGADLRRADLREANLREANLRRANLREANLRGANLSEADLREADLREADLREADLRGADLRRAGIKIFQAGLWTAIISSDFISIGCQRHSAEKWLNFTDEEISVMHPFALEYWKENKDIVFAISQSLNKRLEIK